MDQPWWPVSGSRLTVDTPRVYLAGWQLYAATRIKTPPDIYCCLCQVHLPAAPGETDPAHWGSVGGEGGGGVWLGERVWELSALKNIDKTNIFNIFI